jgi:hypothetical protein
MIRLVELVFAVIALFVIVSYARRTFRRTPPDNRGESKGRMAMAAGDGPRKPGPSSIKLDLPKDPD